MKIFLIATIALLAELALTVGVQAQNFYCPGRWINNYCVCPNGQPASATWDGFSSHYFCAPSAPRTPNSQGTAQTTQWLNWCTSKDGATPDLIISGCTALIESGRFDGRPLALAFKNRGDAYKNKDQLDHATQDYRRAIRIDPIYNLTIPVRDIALTVFRKFTREKVRKFTREKVCEPVMRDVFFGQSTKDIKKLESDSNAFCALCFWSGAEIDLQGEELVDVVLVLTGDLDSLTSEAKSRAEAKYDALFKQCSEQLNAKLAAELNSAK